MVYPTPALVPPLTDWLLHLCWQAFLRAALTRLSEPELEATQVGPSYTWRHGCAGIISGAGYLVQQH